MGPSITKYYHDAIILTFSQFVFAICTANEEPSSVLSIHQSKSTLSNLGNTSATVPDSSKTMPSLVQIFVVGGERKRRRVEGAAAAAFLSSALVGAVSTTTTTSTSTSTTNITTNDTAPRPRKENEQNQEESGGGGGATPTGDGENKTFVLEDRMLAVLRQQEQEEKRKAQEDFDSLLDDQHVFGIPQMIGNHTRRSAADCSAASSHDGGQNPSDDLFTLSEKDNSLITTSEGLGDDERSGGTNNSTCINTANTQQTSSNINESCNHVKNLDDDAYFEERCNQLLRYKEEFGHCNVPLKYSENPSLGQWCDTMRSTHPKIKKGIHKSSRVLSKARIERLEQIGFLWQFSYRDAGVFDNRCRQLIAFRDEFGHCNVPQRYKADRSLGMWCKVMRASYRNRLTTHSRVLSQDRIVRLEEIGFQWGVRDNDAVFENRCRQLIAFKEEFGHCNVPKKCGNGRNLGRWCSVMRVAYSRIQRGLPNKRPFPAERIARLEKIGFQWHWHISIFEKHCCELEDFKKEFGHCNVPIDYPANPTLATWCKAMRTTYNKAQKGETSNRILSEDRVERLNNIGFKWQGAQPMPTG